MLVSQFGETIRIRRKELGITQPHLAELAEISTNEANKRAYLLLYRTRRNFLIADSLME